MAATAFRLTTSDQATMRAAVAECIATAVAQSVSGHPHHEAEVLRRLAAHSLGCSLFDLRDVEVEWLDGMVAEALADA